VNKRLSDINSFLDSISLYPVSTATLKLQAGPYLHCRCVLGLCYRINQYDNRSAMLHSNLIGADGRNSSLLLLLQISTYCSCLSMLMIHKTVWCDLTARVSENHINLVVIALHISQEITTEIPLHTNTIFNHIIGSNVGSNDMLLRVSATVCDRRRVPSRPVSHSHSHNRIFCTTSENLFHAPAAGSNLSGEYARILCTSKNFELHICPCRVISWRARSLLYLHAEFGRPFHKGLKALSFLCTHEFSNDENKRMRTEGEVKRLVEWFPHFFPFGGMFQHVLI
jgi:hypothetical protein